uniref:Monocarboxylate transporter 13 n=1 Tax=Denticeps clupeoides TaxID=299321 RepID=A0AAY4DWA5_9TELE
MEPCVKRPVGRQVLPPDGGYGWFIVLSTFLVFGLTFGIIKAFGVFFVEIQQHFVTSATECSWITSIAVATIHFGAPFGSALSAYFSPRSVVMFGGLLSAVGMVAGAYAQSLPQLYFCVGFLSGFGYALTWTPTVTTLGWYFNRRRPLANALSSTGECIITFLFTPLFQLFVDQYSWRSGLLLLGGLQLHLCVCGALLRPLTQTKETRLGEEEGLELEPEDHAETTPDSKFKPVSATSERTCFDFKRRVQRYVDYSLIGSAHFMVYSMFGLFAALGFFAPALFLVPYARSLGIEEYRSAALLSISAALDLTGRLVFGWVANMRLIKMVHQLMVTVLLLGTVLLLCPLATTFGQLVAFSAGYGLVFGATVSIHITMLAEVVGVNRLGSALGFFMLIRSCGGLLGPPLAGETIVGLKIRSCKNHGELFSLCFNEVLHMHN